CQCHLQRNAQAYVPKVAMRGKVAGELRQIFTSGDREEADQRLVVLAAYFTQRVSTGTKLWFFASV
ncbi:MAG: transposase, partial [Desulfuromusa sp.]|nr:transposase [Desulfuromusa sp.]